MPTDANPARVVSGELVIRSLVEAGILPGVAAHYRRVIIDLSKDKVAKVFYQTVGTIKLTAPAVAEALGNVRLVEVAELEVQGENDG